MEVKKFLDADGVASLFSKLSLQDYPNNETLVAVLNAIDSTKADKNFENWTFVLSDGSVVSKKVNIGD